MTGLRAMRARSVAAVGGWRLAARRWILIAPAVCALLAAASCGPATTAHRAAAAAKIPASRARPVIVARAVVRYGVEPESVAFGHGSVWLAFRGGTTAPFPPGRALRGRLLRISAETLRVTASWPIVGSPVGLAVTSRYVWVAGDIFGGRPPAYDADHVQQFTVAGALVHSYRVPGPVALAGAGDAAWVEYGGQGNRHVAVQRLRAGGGGRPVRLSAADAPGGYNTPLTACLGGVYAMSWDDNSGRTLIDRIAAGQAAGSVRIGDLGNSVLSCAPGGAYVVVQDGATDYLWHLGFTVRGGRVLAVVRLPGYTHGLGGSDGRPWLELDNADVAGASASAAGTRIWQLGPRTLRPGPWVTLPAEVALSVAAGNRLWTVSPVNGPGDRWVITELAAR
jgi:hypothetical protein